MKKPQKDQPKKAATPRKGRRVCDRKGADHITARQAKKAWPVELGEAAAAVAALNLDVNSSGVNGRGRVVNFLGHEVGSKSAAVDLAVVTAATGSFDQFITTLASELVVTGKRHDAKALRAKLAAHDRHYAGNGKVSFQACVEQVGLGDQFTVIQPAISRLLSLTRKTL